MCTSLEAILRGGAIGVVETDACKTIGIVVADHEARIVYVNDRIVDLFHYTVEELTHQPLGMLMHPKVAERHGQWFKEWWNKDRPMREMATRLKIIGRDRKGLDVELMITITATKWYDDPAALAVLLPINWLEVAN